MKIDGTTGHDKQKGDSSVLNRTTDHPSVGVTPRKDPVDDENNEDNELRNDKRRTPESLDMLLDRD